MWRFLIGLSAHTSEAVLSGSRMSSTTWLPASPIGAALDLLRRFEKTDILSGVHRAKTGYFLPFPGTRSATGGAVGSVWPRKGGRTALEHQLVDLLLDFERLDVVEREAKSAGSGFVG